MVNLTDTIKEKWQSGGHQIAKVECTGLRYVSSGTLLDTADQTITSDRICDGGLSIDRTAISGSKLELGSAIAATLSLTLYNTDKKYDDVNFEGVEMKVSVAVDEDSPTWVPLGVFIVDTPPRHLSTISISAMDRMVLFDKDASGFDYDTNSTVAEVIQACAKAAGVSLADTNMKNLSNYNVQVSKPETQDAITYRTLLQYCAALTGTFAYMDENGKLAFRWYDTTAGFAMTSANRYSSDIYEQDVTITGLTYTVTSEDSEGKETSTVNVYGSADYAFDFTDNLLIAGNAAITQALTVVQSKVIPTTYRPYSAEILPAPWLFPGDAVTYLPVDKDDTTENQLFSIVTNMTYALNGSTTVAGQGETAQSNSYANTSGLTAAQAQILQRVADRVTQERTSREQAVLQLNEQIKNVKAGKDDLLIAGLGLYTTEETLSDGSAVYYYHDKQTLADSSIIYTFQSGGFAYTTNWNGGNPTWTSGFDRNGNLIMNTISTYKLEADDIQAGAITAEKINTSYTNTIHDYADGKADSALTDAKKYADDQSSAAESNANDYTDGKLKDYSTTVEMNTAINQKADSITLEASQKYVTSENLETAVESQVKISTEGFSSRVSAVENNLLYGLNFNLLKDTKAFGSLDSVSKSTLTSDTYNNLAVRSLTTTGSGSTTFARWSEFDVSTVLQNKSMTVSFWAKASDTSAVIRVRCPASADWQLVVTSQGISSTSTDTADVNLTTDWARYWVSYTPADSVTDTDELAWVRLSAVGAATYYVCGAKLEYGTTATDWCPAASESISGQRYSEIKQDIESITLDATKIRLQATTLTWKAENSELKEDGTLTARGMFQSYEDVLTADSKYGRNSIGFDNTNGARLYARFRAWETAAQREEESESGIVRTYYPVVIKGMPTDGNTSGGEAGYGYAAFRYGQTSTIQIKGLTTPRFEMVNYWEADQSDSRHPGVLISLGAPTSGAYSDGATSQGGYIKLMRDDIQKGKSQDGMFAFINSEGAGQITLSKVIDEGDSQVCAYLKGGDAGGELYLGRSSDAYYNPGRAMWYDKDTRTLNINSAIKLGGYGFTRRHMPAFTYVASYASLQTDSNIADAARMNTFAARMNSLFTDMQNVTQWLNSFTSGAAHAMWECT